MKNAKIKRFGATGSFNGQFKDPAGICTDSVGNMIVADSRNHRLQMFDKDRRFVTTLQIKGGRPLKRPSGIVFDADGGLKPTLYVLNLWSDSMLKLRLVKPGHDGDD